MNQEISYYKLSLKHEGSAIIHLILVNEDQKNQTVMEFRKQNVQKVDEASLETCTIWFEHINKLAEPDHYVLKMTRAEANKVINSAAHDIDIDVFD